MAAVATEQTVNITVNDIPVAVPKGELIVEAVKRVGLEIPIFCYHPRMKPVGMCRMCLVEVGTKGPDGSVRMMPKPQAACSLPASEGLVIYTDTERLHTDRRGVLEFLLINHPLDCPICDRGGECPLQNNTLFYGPSTSRYVEIKRHAPKAFPLSKYVTLDLERCIQCGRCVRFTEEISGDKQLGFRFRGAHMQPSTFDMSLFTSKFSGNVIEICPVGALTNSKYRFRARPWDLQTRPAICTGCGNGCNVHFDYRGDQMVRINGRTNEAVNEEWTCDKGKFGHDFYNSDTRLKSVLVRKDNKLVPSEWGEAYRQIIAAFNGGDGSQVAVIGGHKNSNEDVFLIQKLFRQTFKSENIDHRFTKTLVKPSESFEAKFGVDRVQSTIASLEYAKSMLVFGTDLSDEEPIVYLRVRKAWFLHGTKVIVAHHEETDADSFAHTILRYAPGTADVLANGLLALLTEGGSEELKAFTPEYVASVTGVSVDRLRDAAALISEGMPTITTRGLLNEVGGKDAIDSLAQLSKSVHGAFNHFGLHANDEGATLLGMVPGEGGKDTHEILRGCIDGSIKALWVVGCDLFESHPDKAFVAQALENVDFLVVQDTLHSEAANFASIVLPMSAPAESEGTYTNVERRVQRMKQVLPSKGDAKPAWKSFAELAMRVQQERPLFNPGEVMDKIAAEVTAFAGCAYSELEGEGFLLRKS